MDADFWHSKWESQQIGFHKSQANELLVKHLPALKLSQGATLFLPLCGKTLDIAYLLQQGYQVVGSELSEIAVKALFAELNITPTVTTVESDFSQTGVAQEATEKSATGELKLYQDPAKHLSIFCGDFFAITPALMASVSDKIDACYDRAALIALPLEMRETYSHHLSTLIQRAPQLLITLSYDQAIMDGPPFSVIPEELAQHYHNDYTLNCLAELFSEHSLKGKHPATESVWHLIAKKA